MTYEIVPFEYRLGTEIPETYIVLVDGRDGPVFVTEVEAREWVAKQ